MAVGLLSLVLAWMLSGPRLLPIYDGIFLPSGPYHWLQPPAGFVGSVKPKGVTTSIGVSHGPFPLSIVYTPEKLPQARIDLLDGAFKLPAGVKRVIVTITPVIGPALPGNVTPASNVYAFAARTDTGGSLEPAKGKASVDLLAARTHGKPFIEQYRNGKWLGLPTGQYVGVSVYSVPTTTLGDFVLVTPGAPSSGGSSGILRTVVIVISGFILLVAVAVILIRLRRQRAGPA